MQSYLMFLPQQGNDLHMTLFKALERSGIKDFAPDNPQRKNIVFHTNGKHIIARTSSVLDGNPIPMSKETLDVVNGSEIQAIVTLSRDRRIMTSKEEREAFIKKHKRLPKSNENHINIRMTDDDVNAYIPTLLEKAGLSDVVFKISDSPLSYQDMSKRRKSFKTMDISFTAKVTDLEAFEQAWLNGIGQVKTYGFGMIRAAVK